MSCDDCIIVLVYVMCLMLYDVCIVLYDVCIMLIYVNLCVIIDVSSLNVSSLNVILCTSMEECM